MQTTMVITRLCAALGVKIVVCQPGSTQVAKSFKNTVEAKAYITTTVRMPDINRNSNFRPLITRIYEECRDTMRCVSTPGLFQILHNFINRPVQLWVFAIKSISKPGFNINIRRYAGFFDIVAIQGKATPCWYAIK